MKDNDLVIARKSFTNNRHIDFKEGKIYRCSIDNESDRPYYMVYGEWFNEVAFQNKFIPLIDVVKEEFEAIGLTNNGKPISKTKFKEMADIHKYGKLPVLYFYLEHARNVTYGFFPVPTITTQKDAVDYAYRNMKDCLNGEVYEQFDKYKTVQRGNTGIPIVYNDLTWRSTN